MKIRKNLEGVFLVAAALTVLGTYASAMAAPRPQPVAVIAQDLNLPLATVEVHAKRLSDAEKNAAR